MIITKPILILFLLMSVVLSAELITDSKLNVEYSHSYDSEPWQYWYYNTQKQDFEGRNLSAGFMLKQNGLCRRINFPEPREVINAVIIKGKIVNNRIVSDGSKSFRGRFNLQKTKEFLKSISSIEGAFFENGKIFIIGKSKGNSKSTSILAEDFVVAFRAVANTPYRGAAAVIESFKQTIGVPTFGKIKYEGFIANSHLGQVMFESDRILKSLALGCDNITKKVLTIDREWHLNKFDFVGFPKKNVREEWHRFWFIVDGFDIQIDNKNNILRIADDRLSVAVRRTKIKNGQRVFYFDKKYKTPESKFSKHFNKYFLDYSREYPVIGELVETAKLIAVVKWLYLQGIIVKFDKQQTKGYYSRYTPTMTPIIKVSKTRTKKIIDLRKYEVTEVTISSTGGADARNFKWKKKKLSGFLKSVKNNPEYVVFNLF